MEDTMNSAQIDTVLEARGSDQSSLVAILQEIQKREGYLPKKTLELLAEKMKIPLSRLYAMSTFYRAFSMVPTGKHHVCVCMGTACHVRGGQAMLNKVEQLLGTRAGQTTRDRRFTVDTVRCLGCCSIGPVVKIDDDTFGRVKQEQIESIMAKYQ
jgi:NADH-quinone oxidoreductase subunit E